MAASIAINADGHEQCSFVAPLMAAGYGGRWRALALGKDMKCSLFLFLSLLPLSSSAGPSKDVKPFDYAPYGGKQYCLKSDFDGNGITDHTAPMGEGWIRVFMNYGTKEEKGIDIDGGGVAELYEPREHVGAHGEPAVKNPSILVRWVGQSHVVFTWDGQEFKKLSYPGYDGPR